MSSRRKLISSISCKKKKKDRQNIIPCTWFKKKFILSCEKDGKKDKIQCHELSLKKKNIIAYTVSRSILKED